ncbi:hypothetical protein DRN74_01690 [Candidatus Micrarchaeota archaeon]|nr:MAG: hypothetical protein DRN74_01690 [Candidatus Micrarchaeota archaeon]
MKGLLFSVDSVLALLLLFVISSTYLVMLEVQEKNKDNVLMLSRLARDIIDIRYYQPSYSPPDWLKEENCQHNVVSLDYFVYDSSSNKVIKKTQKVCFNE